MEAAHYSAGAVGMAQQYLRQTECASEASGRVTLQKSRGWRSCPRDFYLF